MERIYVEVVLMFVKITCLGRTAFTLILARDIDALMSSVEARGGKVEVLNEAPDS